MTVIVLPPTHLAYIRVRKQSVFWYTTELALRRSCSLKFECVETWQENLWFSYLTGAHGCNSEKWDANGNGNVKFCRVYGIETVLDAIIAIESIGFWLCL